MQAILQPLAESMSNLVPDSLNDTAASDSSEPTDQETAEATQAIRELVDSYLEHLAPQLRSVLREPAWHARVNRRGFSSRLLLRWGRGLRRLEYLGVLAYETGAEISALTLGTTDPVLTVLRRLHARSCCIYQEVLVLLRQGFADGANARWRTLHEAAVTALFVSQHGPATAERYLEHEVIESAKGAEEYQRWYSRLGYDPIEPAVLEDLRREQDRVVKAHGPVFRNPHGWAAAALGRQDRFGFDAVEAAVDLSHLRPFYRMASHSVHAASKGATFSLSQPFWPPRALLAGPSNAGLADPGQCAAQSLVLATSSLLLDEPTLDRLIMMRLLSELAIQATDELMDAHWKLEAEENAANADP